MQRKALLLYLRELRDLEFAYWKLEKLYNISKGTERSDGWTTRRKRGFKICLIISLSCMFLLVAVVTASGNVVSNPLLQGLFIAGMLLFDGMAFGIYIFAENDQRKRTAFLEKEKAKVASLRERNYNLDIIPVYYRNIAAIYYIYDSMLTSNASLEEIFFNEDTEYGVQHIADKLDYIINLNYESAIQNRRAEAINQQMLKMNKEMLEQLVNKEKQDLISMQYAEFSANYSDATTYFGLADYL